MADVQERDWRKYLLARRQLAPTGCWEWGGFRDPDGYGALSVRRPGTYPERVMIHRKSYETFVGPIPKGLQILHRCDNPPCFNPEHLYAGTHVDNMRDMHVRGRAAQGERNANSKLDADQVATIRAKAAAGESQRAIARELGLSQYAVWRIVRNEHWRVDGAPGLIARGRRDKLADEDVAVIRSSSESQASLARRFGVDQSTISRIRSGLRRRASATV